MLDGWTRNKTTEINYLRRAIDVTISISVFKLFLCGLKFSMHANKIASSSRERSLPDPLPWLRPWTPLGDSLPRPPDICPPPYFLISPVTLGARSVPVNSMAEHRSRVSFRNRAVHWLITGFQRGDTVSTVSLRQATACMRDYWENRISGNPVAVGAMPTSQNNKTVGAAKSTQVDSLLGSTPTSTYQGRYRTVLASIHSFLYCIKFVNIIITTNFKQKENDAMRASINKS